jgi:hypothetical protein
VFSKRCMQDPHEGHRLRQRTVSASPVCSGHVQHTRRGHSVPEICLQRGCKIPAMSRWSLCRDMAGISVPWCAPRYHRELINGAIFPCRHPLTGRHSDARRIMPCPSTACRLTEHLLVPLSRLSKCSKTFMEFLLSRCALLHAFPSCLSQDILPTGFCSCRRMCTCWRVSDGSPHPATQLP